MILAAGGDFDPLAWNSAAWLDGLGILPLPLKSPAMGLVRDDRGWATSKDPPLTLDLTGLAHYYFRPEGISDDQLRDALGPPVFFQKIVVPAYAKDSQDPAAKAKEEAAAMASAEAAVSAAAKYFGDQHKELSDIDRNLATDHGYMVPETSGGGDRQQKIADLQQRREKVQPSWLTWKQADSQDGAEQAPVEELAERARPQVLARYSNGLPMLVRRQWGRGQVLFLTTSLSPEWTTLHDLPQSAWLMDHIARNVLAETLPSWNVSTEKGVVVPVALGERSAQFTLIGPEPDKKSQVLTVNALGGDRHGLGLDNLTQRGTYRVKAMRNSASGGNGAAHNDEGLLWEIPLAVNGPAEESKLVPAQTGQARSTSFVDASAQVYAVAPMQLEGVNAWKWLIGLVLVLLLAEFLLAARSTSRGEAAS